MTWEAVLIAAIAALPPTILALRTHRKIDRASANTVEAAVKVQTELQTQAVKVAGELKESTNGQFAKVREALAAAERKNVDLEKTVIRLVQKLEDR